MRLMTKIPVGSTHFLPADELDYKPQPTFMKWGFWFHSLDSAITHYRWYWWDGNRWYPETGFCDRHKKLKPISDYVVDALSADPLEGVTDHVNVTLREPDLVK